MPTISAQFSLLTLQLEVAWVYVFRNGKKVIIIRGFKACKLLENLHAIEFSEQQQLMVRITENYKRLKEYLAKKHRRN